jgi:5'-nucleotidase (lipoprotein e(P4) family)
MAAKTWRINFVLLLGIFVNSIIFIGCVSTNIETSSKNNLLNYNHDLLMGILWQQDSGEYPALCYQAFNMGKKYISSLNLAGEKAVVFDIDETVLDNSKYAAWMVITGSAWSNETWEAWCNAQEAYAVPGSLDFANFLVNQGIEIFYISNRPISVIDSTIKNLMKLGFPMADLDHVFLQENTSDKNPRLKRIRDSGYEIVLLAGDSLEDFDGSVRRGTNQERKEWVVAQIESFGNNRIVLPNAVYGSFESAIVPNYYGLSIREKAEARLGNINGWEP